MLNQQYKYCYIYLNKLFIDKGFITRQEAWEWESLGFMVLAGIENKNN